MSRLRALLDVIPALLAAWLLWTIGSGWLARLPHPYDLEWMEGGMLAHAWRLTHGLPLYPEPGPDFVSFVYPPGYTSLLAALGQVFPLDHALGRGLAATGTLAAAAAILAGVGWRGRSWVAGALGAAMFLGTWPASGAFFDLVRPDSIAVAFLGWAVVAGLDQRKGAPIAAGLLLAAAWACKHNTAAFGVPLMLGIAARDGWPRAVRFALAAGVPALLVTVFMQVVSDGRFLLYLLGVPGSHPTAGPRIMPGTPGELAVALPIAVVLAGGFVLLRALEPEQGRLQLAAAGAAGALITAATGLALEYPKGVEAPHAAAFGATLAVLGATATVGALRARAGWRAPAAWPWVYGGGVALVAIVTGALMRGHHGGFVNVFMPLHWVVAFSAAMAVARARERWPGSGTQAVTAMLVAAQLALQVRAIELPALTPTVADVRAGDAVVALLRERCQGPVLSPFASWLPVQAGFAPSAHLIAIWDIDHDGGPFDADMASFVEAAASGHWDCIVQGGRQDFGFPLQPYYQPAERFRMGPRDLMPRTGWRVRPSELHVRRP